LDPSIQVQPFERADLERVAAIEEKSFGPDAWDRNLLLEHFRVSPELFLVAKVGRRIQGYSITVPFAVSRSAELVSIAVDPRARQRGLGRALLNATRAQLQQRHIKTWWLMVRVTNETAIRFYEQCGFTKVRAVKRYYGAGRDAWRMRTTL
jgi:[ribosomal protein S18]-alanine N-acetyltransferase